MDKTPTRAHESVSESVLSQTVSVSRQAATPLHDQVKSVITQMISREGLEPGDPLPSEHRLCHDLGVSRTVVRQALAQLENSGVVYRERGKGTFVAARKTSESFVNSLSGLYDDVVRRGGTVESDVLEQRFVPADSVVAKHLEVEPGDTVMVLRRMRYVDGEPWALSTSWLPENLGHVVSDANMQVESLYRILERAGIVAASGRRSVESVAADEPTARLLNVNEGSPVLKLSSLRRSHSGVPIDYFVAYHRGDRSRFEYALEPDESRARMLVLNVEAGRGDSP
jgi:GntR family transcriptional regulator